jgi:hypothetical protein
MVGKSGSTKKMANGEGSARSFFKLALEIFVLARERVAAYGRDARKHQGLRAIEGGRTAAKICGRDLQISRLIAAGWAVKWGVDCAIRMGHWGQSGRVVAGAERVGVYPRDGSELRRR